MPQQISREDVRKAIASKPFPQPFEQIASTLESSLRLRKDSVSPQSLSRTVKFLVENGHVITVTDRTLVRELGAHPQHYGPRTKFFLSIEVARKRIAKDTLRDLQEAQQVAKQEGAPGPAATAPPAAQRRRATRKTARAEAPALAAPAPPPELPAPEQDAGAEPGTRQPRHLRALTPVDPELLAAKLTAPPHAFTPAFSAAPDTAGPARSADEVLAEVTTRVSAILAKTAATLQREVDAVVLRENQRWHKGEFGPDSQRVAEQLQALYGMVESNASALKSDATMLTRGASRRPQAAARTGTC